MWGLRISGDGTCWQKADRTSSSAELWRTVVKAWLPPFERTDGQPQLSQISLLHNSTLIVSFTLSLSLLPTRQPFQQPLQLHPWNQEVALNFSCGELVSWNYFGKVNGQGPDDQLEDEGDDIALSSRNWNLHVHAQVLHKSAVCAKRGFMKHG